MITDDGRRQAADLMIAAIRPVAKTTRRFRIHESGDFFSPRYVEFWKIVAEALPEVTFWAPTRTWHMRGPLWQTALQAFASLPNVVCRPSSLQFDEAAPEIEWMAASGNVHTGEPLGEECPVSLKGISACGPCTRCWDKPEVIVSYRAHTLQQSARTGEHSEREKAA